MKQKSQATGQEDATTMLTLTETSAEPSRSTRAVSTCSEQKASAQVLANPQRQQLMLLADKNLGDKVSH